MLGLKFNFQEAITIRLVLLHSQFATNNHKINCLEKENGVYYALKMSTLRGCDAKTVVLERLLILILTSPLPGLLEMFPET